MRRRWLYFAAMGSWKVSTVYVTDDDGGTVSVWLREDDQTPILIASVPRFISLSPASFSGSPPSGFASYTDVKLWYISRRPTTESDAGYALGLDGQALSDTASSGTEDAYLKAFSVTASEPPTGIAAMRLSGPGNNTTNIYRTGFSYDDPFFYQIEDIDNQNFYSVSFSAIFSTSGGEPIGSASGSASIDVTNIVGLFSLSRTENNTYFALASNRSIYESDQPAELPPRPTVDSIWYGTGSNSDEYSSPPPRLADDPHAGLSSPNGLIDIEMHPFKDESRNTRNVVSDDVVFSVPSTTILNLLNTAPDQQLTATASWTSPGGNGSESIQIPGLPANTRYVLGIAVWRAGITS